MSSPGQRLYQLLVAPGGWESFSSEVQQNYEKAAARFLAEQTKPSLGERLFKCYVAALREQGMNCAALDDEARRLWQRTAEMWEQRRQGGTK